MPTGHERLDSYLAGPSSWSELVHLEEVDSTNLEVARRVRDGAPAGLVLVADRQTAGRGRNGRGWQDVPGGNLSVSVATGVPGTGCDAGAAGRGAGRGRRAQARGPDHRAQVAQRRAGAGRRAGERARRRRPAQGRRDPRRRPRPAPDRARSSSSSASGWTWTGVASPATGRPRGGPRWPRSSATTSTGGSCCTTCCGRSRPGCWTCRVTRPGCWPPTPCGARRWAGTCACTPRAAACSRDGPSRSPSPAAWCVDTGAGRRTVMAGDVEHVR